VLGDSCQIDNDLKLDDLGNCDRLVQAFSQSASFICCNHAENTELLFDTIIDGSSATNGHPLLGSAGITNKKEFENVTEIMNHKVRKVDEKEEVLLQTVPHNSSGVETALLEYSNIQLVEVIVMNDTIGVIDTVPDMTTARTTTAVFGDPEASKLAARVYDYEFALDGEGISEQPSTITAQVITTETDQTETSLPEPETTTQYTYDGMFDPSHNR
jgi:hypothetical protein